MKIDFRVEGLPPKKDGANSMWGKPYEVIRIQRLRKAAMGALGEQGPFRTKIDLELELHLPSQELVQVGDLDNFITGVCDGLQAASSEQWRSHQWEGEEWERVQPGCAVGIEDDGEIVSIAARKVEDGTGPWYTVRLNGKR